MSGKQPNEPTPEDIARVMSEEAQQGSQPARAEPCEDYLARVQRIAATIQAEAEASERSHEAKAAADTAYDLVGATAIFIGNDFERRFRDIHTVTQQLQGRKAHLQSVGAFLLGLPPDLDIV